MVIASVMSGAGAGGAEFAAVELLDAMVALGHKATMLSDWPGIARDTEVGVASIQLGPKLSLSTLLMFLLTWPLMLLGLRRALDAQQPYDVLLLNFKKDQLLGSLLPKRLRAHLVWAEWGPVPWQVRSGPGRWAYAAASRRAAAVLAISENTRDSVIEAGVEADKVVVVPNAIRTAQFEFNAAGRARIRERLGIPAAAFVVGCTSRFHPKKRNDVAIDAVAKLGDEVHLILAGEGEAEADLRSRATPLGARAHFLPTPSAAEDLFSAFDICVFCPSPAEGSPTAVILGMLAGRPCVASAREGVAGLIGDGCGAVATPENDPEALATILRHYAGDPERVRREGALAQQRAKARFDSAVVGKEAEQLFGVAIAGSGR